MNGLPLTAVGGVPSDAPDVRPPGVGRPRLRSSPGPEPDRTSTGRPSARWPLSPRALHADQAHPARSCTMNAAFALPPVKLTQRELHFLKGLAAGHSLEGLAGALGISMVTAKAHVRRAREQLFGARSAPTAVAVAYAVEAIPPP